MSSGGGPGPRDFQIHDEHGTVLEVEEGRDRWFINICQQESRSSLFITKDIGQIREIRDALTKILESAAGRPPNSKQYEERREEVTIKGVQFVTDTEGHKVAVLLDLKEWGELWEDIYDSAIAEERAGDPVEPWEQFRERLVREGKLDG